MILMWDEAVNFLYTVASMGYPASGVGSEIPLGCGIIGVAAQARAPIRISHMATEYSYERAIRNSTEAVAAIPPVTEIPPPGLAELNSQLAVPICSFERLRGVLFVETPQDLRFSYDDEDALVTLANQIGTLIHQLEAVVTTQVEPIFEKPAQTRVGTPLVIKHYSVNQAIFLNDDYLIKGIAGAIFWKLVRNYAEDRRNVFSNRELRLDSSLHLPRH